MFNDWDYVKPEDDYVDEDELQHTRATFIKEALGDDYQVERIYTDNNAEGDWVVIKEFGNECGILIDDGIISEGKIFAVNMLLYHNDDPTDAMLRIEDVRLGKIQETADDLYKRSETMMEQVLKEREEEANRRPEISHINLDANEKVTFEGWDGNRVTVAKEPTDYGICKYSVTIEGYADVITDIAGDAPEVSAEQRSKRNDDLNDGIPGAIRYAKCGPDRTMVTFGDSSRSHDYGGGLYGGGIAIYKDLITRNYIVSTVGNVDVIQKEKSIPDEDIKPYGSLTTRSKSTNIRKKNTTGYYTPEGVDIDE